MKNEQTIETKQHFPYARQIWHEGLEKRRAERDTMVLGKMRCDDCRGTGGLFVARFACALCPACWRGRIEVIDASRGRVRVANGVAR